MDSGFEDPLTSCFNEEQQIDTIDALFASESDQIVPSSLSKSRICFRQQAVSLIFQGQYSGKFNPIVSYLAATYVGRFITAQEIPEDNPWILRLLVIASVSLASKMNQSDLSFSDIQRDEEGYIFFFFFFFVEKEGYIFDAQTITRMELTILNALNWRMRLTTPFLFIHYFLSLTNCRDPGLIQALKARVVDIIFKAHQETAFLDFNPSVLASSAILHASQTLSPLEYPAFRLAISSCKYVNTVKLWSCYRLMEEKLLLTDRSNNETLPSLSTSTTKTPRSVLEINDNHDFERFELINRPNDSGSETVAVTTVTTEKEERNDVKRQRRLDDIFRLF